MTLRTPSRRRQWVLWALEALLAAAVYVVVMRVVFGAVTGGVFSPYSQRVLLPVVALFLLVARETRWDGVARGTESEEMCPADCQGKPAEGPVTPAVRSNARTMARPSPEAEAFYAAAREIPHEYVVSYVHDGAYMELLGKAALAGHNLAPVKLGEYAMRRHDWMEAYYWLWLAQRNGAREIESVLRQVRQCWVMEGYPSRDDNVNDLFTKEMWSTGHALLCAVTGHDAKEAREYLREKGIRLSPT